MTLQDRQTFLQLFFSGCLAIAESKGKDYNPHDIPFMDVLESAVDKNDTIPGILWVLYLKHAASIKKHFLHNAPLESEPILKRLQDAANYFALLACYETHKQELHAQWRAYWVEQVCEYVEPIIADHIYPVHNPECHRCQTLSWLERAAFGLGSQTS